MRRDRFEQRSILWRKRWENLKATEPRFVDLLAIARVLRVGFWISELPSNTLGVYMHAERRIWLDVDLAPREMLSVLAHEVGHAVYQHPGPADDPAQELEADEWAASFLIRADDWDTYIETYGGCTIPFLADCFGVEEHLIRVQLERRKRERLVHQAAA